MIGREVDEKETRAKLPSAHMRLKRDAARATSADMKQGYERLVKSWDQLIGEMETATMRPKQDAR